MIDSINIKQYLHLKDVKLAFSPGLNLFSGPSGAGKSVFMEAILSTFGLKDAQNNSTVEIEISNPLNLEKYGLEDDDINIFKQLKKDKSRYFINNQSSAKKSVSEIAKSFINFLSLRDYSEFENDALVEMVDALISGSDKTHNALVSSYTKSYQNYRHIATKLSELQAKELKINELIDYTKYEHEKITAIDPKEEEYDELMHIKKRLSKKEKIEQAMAKAQDIFEYEGYVNDLFVMSDKNSDFFDEAMNELRMAFDEINDSVNELEGIDIEQTLDRIEKLSDLKHRYGSIAEAIVYKEKKEQELYEYTNFEEELSSLKKEKIIAYEEVQTYADTLTSKRQKILPTLNEKINSYLKMLYLDNGSFYIDACEYHALGQDNIGFNLQNISLKKLSTGEFNRVRLAFLAVRSHYFNTDNGILFLDEIDANLSGKESMSVAKVLKELSQTYQIFSISHQPQLSATADAHFLIYKSDEVGHASVLAPNERIHEIARIISGENITDEAIDFAKKLLEESS